MMDRIGIGLVLLLGAVAAAAAGYSPIAVVASAAAGIYLIGAVILGRRRG